VPYKDPAEKKRRAHDHYLEHKEEIQTQQATYRNTPERKKRAIERANKRRERIKGTPSYRYVWLKSQAKQRNIKLEISFDEYEALISNEFCRYCKNDLPIHGHGLDRVDNRLGYAMTNVVPCCTQCNTRKGLLEKIGFVFPRTVELLKELLASRT
jgi:hypothetical protein